MDFPAANETKLRLDDLNLTVHEYHNSTSIISRASQIAIVSEAYNLLKGTLPQYSKWTTRAARVPVLTSNPRNCFTLAKVPPFIEISFEGERLIKEWGSSLTENEIFHLNELEDFVGTDLTYFLESKHNRGIISPEPWNNIKDGDVDSSHRASKKRKLSLESIYYLIPQPHMHPSPFLSSEAPLVDAKLLSAEPRFVSPYSSLSLDVDVRAAWLIPVRGVPPWEGSSSGTLLDDDFDHLSVPSDGYNAQILWTSDSLLKFWDFLVELRTTCSVGSLGISFHASQGIQRARGTTAIHKTCAFSTPVPMSNSVSAGSRPTLLTLDYIKVYHDVGRRLHVRHLLDQWSYSYTVGNGHSPKVKVLKDARLVLLDDVSQAILVL